MSARAVPPPFLLPGAAGLLPFAAGALAAWLGPDADRSLVLHWLCVYAAVILAFVGALHWGVAVMDPAASPRAQWIATLWSVTPALVGWAALQLPTHAGLRVIAGALLIQYAMDRLLAQRHPLPPWFLRLRLGLTAGAVACVLVASFA
jgi:hypothetical protein